MATIKQDMLRIIKTKHESVKFHCTQCDYKATQKGTFNRHVKSIHEGVKFPCDQCDFQATHLIIHNTCKIDS